MNITINKEDVGGTARPFITVNNSIIYDKNLELEDIGLFVIISFLSQDKNQEYEIKNYIGKSRTKYHRFLKLVRLNYIDIDLETSKKVLLWDVWS
jgi:hypothetical protein